jgi:hypothetical protein
MHTLREHLHLYCRRQPISVANEMFEIPTQLSSIMLEIAIVRAAFLMTQDDDITDWQSNNDEREGNGESALSSDIKEADLNIRQMVQHQDQEYHDNTIQTTRVPLQKKRSRADTVIACTPLPNLRHPVRAIVPPLLIRQ